MSNKNLTILIVEDIEENREFLVRKVEAEGYSVVTANDGQEGLDQLLHHHIDLILLDIKMPGMDGVTMLAHVRDDHAMDHIPAIMVTAVEDMSVALSCLNKGACGYITKPYDMEQLNTQIKNCLQKENKTTI